MATIREQLKIAGDAPSGSSWLVRLVWALVDVDEPGLEDLDRAIATILWPDGQNHTISWHLGKLVSEGDPVAIGICGALGEFLGKDHCLNAYEHGS